MSVNIYTTKDSGDLKFLAEVEDATISQAQEIVEAVLEQSPRLQGPFTLIDADSLVVAEQVEEEVTEVVRRIVINGDGGSVAAKPKAAPKRNPNAGSRRRSTGKKGKAAPKRRSAPAAKAKSGGGKSRPAIRGGGLRRNNAGDE
jgi:hypothetical protein